MTPAPKRRWFQFSYSLGALFLVISVLGVGLGIASPLRIVRGRLAGREWIERNRGQVFYYAGAWEHWNKRGRIERAQGDFSMPAVRTFLGDEKLVLIAIPDDGSFSESEAEQVKNIFPEADIWFDP